MSTTLDNMAPPEDEPYPVLVCNYCGQDVTGEPSQFQCCGEIGHVKEVNSETGEDWQ